MLISGPMAFDFTWTCGRSRPAMDREDKKRKVRGKENRVNKMQEERKKEGIKE